MKLIKAGTSGLNAKGLVAKSEFVEGEMTGNVNFTTPNPTIVSLTAARVALVAAIAQSESRAIADIVVRNELALELRTLLVNLARYVNNVAAGDVDKAVTSGFEPAKRPEPSTHLDAPGKLEALHSAFEGCVDLRWKRVPDARMYQVYMVAGDATDQTQWTVVAVCSRTSTRIKGLTPGADYSFRVTALGRIGEGPASGVVSKHAAAA